MTREQVRKSTEAARGGLLALPPGVGKTYTCVALALSTWVRGQSTVAAVVRAPTHLSIQWKREILRFCPNARVIDSATDDPVTEACVRDHAGPTFVLATPRCDLVASGVAFRGGSDAPEFARKIAGVRAQRTFIDEAHEMVASPLAPCTDEATWAVTATPFFSTSASRDALFDVLQKVPRHFGLPKCHGQLLNLFHKDAGTIFQTLTLNLHELQDMLPRITKSVVTIDVQRNDAAFQTFTSRVMDLAARQRDSWLTSRTGLEALVRSANNVIRIAAQRGVVLYVDELFAARNSPYGFAFLNPTLTTRRFPEYREMEAASPQIAESVVARMRELDDDCVVCLESLRDELVVLPCAHVLHYACLRNWYQSNLGLGLAGSNSAAANRCAMCRREYGIDDLRSLTIGSEASGPRAIGMNAAGATDAREPTSGASNTDPAKWTFDEVHIKAVDMIAAHLDKREGKAIVFLDQHSAMRLHGFLRARGIAFVNCIEAATEEARARAIASFVNSDPDVLLIDPKSETGLNLTVANFVLNYAGHHGSWDQIVGRVRRLGQMHAVHVVQMRVNTDNMRAEV